MRNRKLWAVISLLGGMILIQACDNGLTGIEDDVFLVEKSAGWSEAPGDSCTYSGDLTDADITGILEMREEEKLARDVYLYFYEMYGHSIFSNIASSEDAHTTAVFQLIEGYGLGDPALEGEGEFSNPVFTELYQQLTEQGSASLVDALKTGAFIEEYDINDLVELLAETENSDIINVYGNLLKGSENHLRAFVNVLESLGEEYEPAILEVDDYLEILSESNDNKKNQGKKSNSQKNNQNQKQNGNSYSGNS